MIRGTTAMIMALVGGSAAYSMDAFPHFAGAAIGAFIAVYIRDSRKHLRIIVDEALREYAMKHQCPWKSMEGIER